MLKFQHFQTIPDLTFWKEFTKLKLQEWKLAETAVPIQAHYTCSGSEALPGALKLDEASFQNRTPDSDDGRVCIPGELLNYNTVEGFKKADRMGILREMGSRILADIKSGAAEDDPSLLCKFLLTSYADLKSYKFFYWFAFPALKLSDSCTVQQADTISNHFGEELAGQLVAKTQEMLQSNPSTPGFWTCWLIQDADLRFHVGTLSEAKSQGQDTEVYLCMADPSGKSEQPGWSVRNVLFMAAMNWGWREAKVICWNTRRGRFSVEHSTLLHVTIPAPPPDSALGPDVTGWSPNAKNVLAPRVIDLGTSMDPQHFAASAADLNIRLMKWRAAPSLDVDKLAATKCLLLGAGTLGCAVARTLLGWGVRQITFIDNSKVSYSNPVRQSLYEFEDCKGEGQPKAQAAAKKLKEIFPVVQAEGIQMNIPMPGHPLSGPEIEEAKTNAEKLEQLILSHDAVYLLMDTRESRWLPSLLCAVHNKLAINAALGFDQYLVMRHGGSPDARDKNRLGCYYCNDIIAPLDSTVDRTLDQQCTVARPGLAPIAGALAVEMMAAVVQDPAGVQAPPPSSASADLPLGAAPHMIRGSMGTFSHSSLTGEAYSQCTACSQKVVDGYREGGWEWLFPTLQDPKSLEDLTGLTEMKEKMAAKQDTPEDSMQVLDSDDDFEAI